MPIFSVLRAGLRHAWRRLWLVAALLSFGGLASYQLGLPGLHYDEAKEAGINAMELLTGAPVTAFRDATISLFGLSLPLMVQDYIGALNVYLALPFLGISGIGVPNLRFLALAQGLLGLILFERAITAWLAFCQNDSRDRLPISLAGLIGVSLLALSPSFIFWQRQGIFVTNTTFPATFGALWLGLTWARTGRTRALFGSAFAAGLALYAKLLAYWLLIPFALGLMGWWIWRRVFATKSHTLPSLTPQIILGTLIAGLLPLLPFLLFNLQTGGTFQSVGQNLEQSYYGINNAAIGANLPIRVGQLVETLRGGQFWYLGGVHQNSVAPWLAGIGIVLGLVTQRSRRRLGPVLFFLLSALLLSLFTVSDLFITHYALVHPLLVATVAIGISGLLPSASGLSASGLSASAKNRRLNIALIGAALALWLSMDLTASLAYHRDLSRSGGLADHSDATYDLAYHLRYNGLGAPIVLDWGIDAPVRYLSQGTVHPIEIFGYDSLSEPDPGFPQRLNQFLPNPDNVYLLRAPDQTVFDGRRAAFLQQAQRTGRSPVLITSFTQRDGTPLFEIWRVP